MRSRLLLAVIMGGFVCAAALGGNSDVEIQAVEKKLNAIRPREEGHRSISTERLNYEVTIENKAFHPLLSLEVRYMIFYRVEELGSVAPAQQRHKSGSFSIAGLQPREKKILPTEKIGLNKSYLVGNWYYKNGGKTRTEDTLVGIWVRVYSGEQVVGEYASPSTLTRETWE